MDRFPAPQNGFQTLALAPMEGVTDAPMRALQTESGAFTYCVSEFLRVCKEPLPEKVFFKHVPELRQGCVTPSGTPVQIQLLGGDPKAMALNAATARRLGAPAVDINFGCPAPTVNRNDGGATLLKHPHRITEIVAACREALPRPYPLSAKLRLGWENTDEIFANAAAAVAGGADWITIHGRTRMAGYSPPIFWEPIGAVRAALAGVPVVANGDIWTIADFQRCREVTGCEHFMVGRGALADPRLPHSIARALAGAFPTGVLPLGGASRDWLPWLQRFHHHASQHPFGEERIAHRLKQWTGYGKRFGQVDFFDRIKRLGTPQEILRALG